MTQMSYVLLFFFSIQLFAQKQIRMPVAYSQFGIGQEASVNYSSQSKKVLQFLDQSATQLPATHIEVRGFDHQVLLKKTIHSFDESDQIPVLSASKWVTGLTFGALIDNQLLSWRDQAEKSGFSKGGGNISELLSFRAGYPIKNNCFNRWLFPFSVCR